MNRIFVGKYLAALCLEETKPLVKTQDCTKYYLATIDIIIYRRFIR